MQKSLELAIYARFAVSTEFDEQASKSFDYPTLSKYIFLLPQPLSKNIYRHLCWAVMEDDA